MAIVSDDDDDDDGGAGDDQNSRFMEQLQNIYCYRDTSGTFVPTELID
jgi:hypothetical protein